MLRPNAQGKIGPAEKVRAGLSRWFFEDRITPVTQTELNRAHCDHPAEITDK